MTIRNSSSIRGWVCAFTFATACFFLPSLASAVTLTFDDVAGLGDYAPGITFSSGAWIWNTAGHSSVLDNQFGTHYSTEDTLCITASCNGAGEVTFDFDIDTFSIVALSGPGTDVLGSGVMIEAFDVDGNLLGTDVAGMYQYELLSITASGIRSVRLTATNVEVWDDLTYETAHMPEPSTAVLLGFGLMGIATRMRKR